MNYKRKIKTTTYNEFGPYKSNFKLIESKNNIFTLSEYTQNGQDSFAEGKVFTAYDVDSKKKIQNI